VSDILLIRLLGQQQVEWFSYTKQGEQVGAPTRGVLGDVTVPDANCQVMVLLPGQQVSMHALKLPGKQAKQQLQAIPFALENDLLGDVGDYFFAVAAKRHADKTLAVAVIRRDYVAACLSQLREVGIEPSVILPDFLLLPYETGAYSVYVENDVALVRTGECAGFAVDAENLEKFLSEQGEQLKCQHLNQPTFLGQVVKAGVVKPPINLLQGEFRAKKRVGVTPWYASKTTLIVLIALLVFITVLGQAAHYVTLSHVVRAQHQRIAQIYKQAFPGEAVPADPKSSMSDRLAALQTGGGNDQALNLIAKLANVLQAYPSLKPQSIDYNSGELTVVLPLVNLQWQRQLLQALRGKQLAVNDSYASGVLTLKIKGAE
jgi:general secretion pathway protein L